MVAFARSQQRRRQRWRRRGATLNSAFAQYSEYKYAIRVQRYVIQRYQSFISSTFCQFYSIRKTIEAVEDVDMCARSTFHSCVDRDGVSNAFQPFHNIYRMLCKRLITFIGCFVSGAYCMEVTGVQWYLSMLKVPRYDWYLFKNNWNEEFLYINRNNIWRK